jgi:hypothetical protein
MDLSLFIIIGIIALIIYIIKLLTNSSQESERKSSGYRKKEQPYYTPGKMHTYTNYDDFFKDNFKSENQKTSNHPYKNDNLPPTVWGKDPIHQLGIPSTTLTGISVKSDAERKIGDYFTNNNILYDYEKEVWGGLDNNKKIRPDFYLPKYDVYVEYWGLIHIQDEEKRAEYETNMNWKLAQYHSQGKKHVNIYPEDMKYLEYAFPRKFKKVTGNKLISEHSEDENKSIPEHKEDEKKTVPDKKENKKSRVGNASPYWSFQKVKKKK